MKKKVLALLLILGCGLTTPIIAGAAEQNESAESSSDAGSEIFKSGDWMVASFVDEFGDSTGVMYAKTGAGGDFSNTATSSSDLGVVFFCSPLEKSISLRVLEYKKNKATYADSSDILLKIKAGNTVYEYDDLYGEAPNGDIFVDEDGEDDNYKQIFELLGTGEDLKCVLYIDDSKYNFTISSDGFSDCMRIFYNGTYDSAVELMNAGEYEEAISKFESIEEYEDSKKMIEDCNLALTENSYNAAVDLKNAGNYEEALYAFYKLKDYKDVEEQMTECKDHIYDTAVELMDAGKYEEARTAFDIITDYKDSADLIEQCNQEEIYTNATQLMDDGKCEEALAQFYAIKDYKDSQDIINEYTLSHFNDVYKILIETVNNNYENAGLIKLYLQNFLNEENMLNAEELASELNGYYIEILPSIRKQGVRNVSIYNYFLINQTSSKGEDNIYFQQEGRLFIREDRPGNVEFKDGSELAGPIKYIRDDYLENPIGSKRSIYDRYFKVSEGIYIDVYMEEFLSPEEVTPECTLELLVKTNEPLTDIDQVINFLTDLQNGNYKLPSTIYTDADTIRKVQEALNSAGYNCGTPDGIAGSGTYAALNAYQDANGLTVENAITDEVLVSMGLK